MSPELRRGVAYIAQRLVEGNSRGSLYDYGAGAFFEASREGNRVKGYDYGSGNFYEATVNGRSVSLYDYERGAFFSYST